MYFNSFRFIGFFVVVFLVVLALRKVVWARNLFLLAASYYFYGCWDWRFLGLIWISTIVDYVCGRLLDPDRPDPPNDQRRKAILTVSILTNLGMLGFFKYFDFFVGSAVEALATAGIQVRASSLGIVLPVGISFYTFQTLSYTIDLYRGQIKAEHNLLNFSLFVAFFPQLVAGPIERASRLLPQMSVPNPITREKLYSGFWLICWGLFKKVVIADNAARIVDIVFSNSSPSGAAALIGMYAFAFQIYCDFSGYSDIARGCARILGFELSLNFNLPYFATNPSDFWRRWHISLSSWLRDYLYIPLGGNRLGPSRTYVNVMLTMTLGGLWHGAAWTFVVWGIYHGLLLAVHRAMAPIFLRVGAPTTRLGARVWYFTRAVVFFHLVCVGWILFRAESLGQAFRMVSSILLQGLAGSSSLLDERTVLFVALAGLLLLFQLFQFQTRDQNAILRLPVPVRAAVYASLTITFLWFGVADGVAFIYFQF